ncbi:MAG: AAA family ATPase [Nanoarchaeota archaeon]|nr:AAA family ATPase [Nanoarchaeota archaeon]
MILKKIILKNIRSYENQEVNFASGSTLLSGDIGSGKTSILLGIEFALFGLQPGQRGSSLLRNGAESGGVLIEFEVDGKQIVIERTLKRGKTISQDDCSITIDGEKREIAVTELKSEVLGLLNYPKEFSKKQNILYKFTVYTPQEEMKQIILQDSETRINTLRHVFGIDKYKKIIENTSIIASKLREEKRKKEGITDNLEQDKLNLVSKEIELGEKKENLLEAEKEFSVKKDRRRYFQQEKDEVSKKIEEKRRLQQEIDKTRIFLSNKKETISENHKLMGEIEEQILQLESLSFDYDEIKKLEEEILLLRKNKEKLNEQRIEMNSLSSSLNLKNEENRKLEQKFSNLEICPTCLQSVEAVYRANVLNKVHSDSAENTRKISELQKEMLVIQENMKKIDSDIFLKEKKINELNLLKIKLQGIDEKKKRLGDMQKITVSLEKDIEILNHHIETLDNSVLELSKFDDVFLEKQKELDKSIEEEQMAEIKVAELKKEIEVFSRHLEELKQNIEKTELVKKQLDYINSLEDWLSKRFIPLVSFVEKNVMIRLKSEFSHLFAEWFSMLVSDSFNVSLNDDFTPIIEYQDYEIDYSYLSGGERTAIALAYRLSLNQIINSLLSKIKTKDLVILDEPTDGFSDQQLDKMRGVLEQLNVNQLIIVSHEQKIEGFVENVLKFRKENGISRME